MKYYSVMLALIFVYALLPFNAFHQHNDSENPEETELYSNVEDESHCVLCEFSLTKTKSILTSTITITQSVEQVHFIQTKPAQCTYISVGFSTRGPPSILY